MVNLRTGLAAFVILTCHRTSAQYDDSIYVFPRTEGEFKFVVAVTSKAGVCTGTIINQRVVLTAAHCMYSKGKMIGDEDAKVLAGIINYEHPKPTTLQTVSSSKVVIHPHFWYNRIGKFDVALVFLRDPMEFNNYVGSIAIADDGWRQDEKNLSCMSLGFGGVRSTAPENKELKTWNVSAGHGEEECPCARRFQYKRLVCVKEIQYPHICRGDDGGPLVCGNVVRAIAHMIWDSSKCDDPTYPLDKCMGGPVKGLSTYTFLCPLNDWIHGIVPDAPPTPVSCKASNHSCHSCLVYLFVFSVCIFRVFRKK